MNSCTKAEFETRLRQQLDDPQSEISGPLIDSAPVGNAFRGPFKEYVWTIGKITVLKKTWTPEAGWQFFLLDGMGGEIREHAPAS